MYFNIYTFKYFVFSQTREELNSALSELSIIAYILHDNFPAVFAAQPTERSVRGSRVRAPST